jgi:hypothetical protein
MKKKTVCQVAILWVALLFPMGSRAETAAVPALAGTLPERLPTPQNVLVVRSKQLDKGLASLKPEEKAVIQQPEIDEIKRQLDDDPVLIPPRLGALFVPRIIEDQNIMQTSYVVYDLKGRQVAQTQSGKKSFVYPGTYIVQIGTATGTILPRYRIQVYASRITIIRARWAALVVLVQDEALVQFRGTYDIIHLTSRRGVGTGIGADERIGEKVRPWLLPPGLYMIVRTGDTYLARTDFFTVQVDAGKVTYFRLVSDRNSGRFLGGGVILLQQLGLHRRGAWNWSIQLSGNVLWNNVENVPALTSGHSFSMTTFLAGRVIFNEERHFFRTFLNVELGFTIPTFTSIDQLDLRKGIDRVEFESIYIFRLLRFLGPYARFGVQTSIFPGFYYLSDLERSVGASIYRCVTETNCVLQTDTAGRAATQTSLGDFFDPLLFKQGLGLNFQALQYAWLDLRILFGLGFRQEIARSVYQGTANINNFRCRDASLRDPDSPWVVTRCPNAADQEQHFHPRFFLKESSSRIGFEVAVVATGQLTRFITFTTEFDMLTQFENFAELDIDWRTTITLRLSHYASLFYRLRVRRDPAIPSVAGLDKWYFDQSAVLSFSILL